MAAEVRIRVRTLFTEMMTLLEEVGSIAQGHGKSTRRDSLSSTGLLWESCDALIELEKVGVAGIALQKAQQYRDTIKDAIDELKEWAEGEDLESEGHDELLDDDDEGVDGDRDSLEDIFNAANSMPKDRPELKKLVGEADGKLKKIVLLYTALVKRRLKTFRFAGTDNIESVVKLDSCMRSLETIPHEVDELASCFYDLDEERARNVLLRCVDQAKAAQLVARLSWGEEKEDEFTAWCEKWREAIG